MYSAFRKHFKPAFQVWALCGSSGQHVKTDVMPYNSLGSYDEPLGLWHYIYHLLGRDWFLWLTGNTVYCGPGPLSPDSWRSSFEVSVCRDEELSFLHLGFSENVFIGNKNIANLCKGKENVSWYSLLLLCQKRLKTLWDLPSLPYTPYNIVKYKMFFFFELTFIPGICGCLWEFIGAFCFQWHSLYNVRIIKLGQTHHHCIIRSNALRWKLT